MTYRTASVAAKAIALSMPATVALGLTVGLHAFAQEKTAPAPDAARTLNGPQSQTPQGGDQEVQVIFSPWTKYCAKSPSGKGSEIKAEEVCFTGSDAHLTSGQKVVIAMLIEPADGDKKLFRVSLPVGVQLGAGTRIVIDEKEAMTAPYVVCLAKTGCMADYKADADLIAKLKKGRSLMVQAFDQGRPISFTFPLPDFAKVYDGPPSDPNGLDQQQESLKNEPQPQSEDHRDAPGSK